jgi:hypothetical protein
MSASLAIPAWVEVERDLSKPFEAVAANPERRVKALALARRRRAHVLFRNLVVAFAWRDQQCGAVSPRR